MESVSLLFRHVYSTSFKDSHAIGVMIKKKHTGSTRNVYL